ncbi:MAG: hypothetical protein IKA17_02870 [Clostridia bacterium]|nr:hypothetical protein [Clostridia bacterium]
MLNDITNTQTKGVSKYEYINTKTGIKQSVPMLNEEERRELENVIVEELYRIFTHKVD